MTGDPLSSSVSDPGVKPQQELEKDTFSSENRNDSVLDLGSPVKKIDCFTLE